MSVRRRCDGGYYSAERLVMASAMALARRAAARPMALAAGAHKQAAVRAMALAADACGLALALLSLAMS